ncbi:MAG: YhfC family intramembrane metalloprotease, partial [Oscillospiraceae bacterium]|nr:YhfC family intramembrane metalloprotease [Oscillospiraceae bacterium]
MVPTSSIVFMAVAGLMAAALAVVPAIVIWRRYKPSILSFFIGAGTFFVFAMLLESLMHAVVLGSSIGETIQASALLYALYGG